MTDDVVYAASVLKPEWLPEYEKQRDAIARQLRELNTMLFILEKIEIFPFWLFINGTQDWVFWRTTRITYIETTLMIASRTIVDTHEDALTLKSYKNAILANVIDDSALQVVRERLKRARFDKRVKATSAKIRDIRNHFLAHHHREQNTLEPDKRISADITFGEIKEVLKAAFDLFDELSFEAYYVPWYWDYGDKVRAEERTDIDRLLEHVAQNSYLFNLPEKDLAAWERRRAKLKPEEIDHLNRYRAKAGLPPVS